MGAAEDKTRFSDIADELGMSGEEKDHYVGEHMLRKGYKAVTDWLDPDPEPTTPPAGSFFSTPGGNRPPAKKVAAPATPPARRGQYE